MNKVLVGVRFLLSIVVLVLCLGLFIPKSNAISFTLKPGDILITKSTSSSGMLGHTGVVTDPTHVLHTSGRDNEPYPLLFTVDQWSNRYASLKVVRPNDSALGKEAANRAIYYFHGSSIPFDKTFAPDPTDIRKTYCSELVWYSYYKAGKAFQIKKALQPGVFIWGNPNVIKPYDFLKSDYLNHNGFKVVYTSNW